MQLIKLSATDSTNTYLRQLLQREELADWTVIVTAHQTAGRGQRGNQWQSEKDKNLTFSLLKKDLRLPVSRNFVLNMVVSVSLYNTLGALGLPDLRVKWPNDILSGGQKIGGILIENQIHSQIVIQSVIGIGLNVNQTDFRELPSASSLRLVMGKEFDLDLLLNQILEDLKKDLSTLQTASLHVLTANYEQILYLMEEPAYYTREDGTTFMGVIQGVHPDGRLKMKTEDGRQQTFDLRELRFHLKAD